jgi:CTP synthase (UTP-ammonia lyase)
VPANKIEGNLLERTNIMSGVGMIGDFNPESETSRATSEALHHAADAVGTAVRVSWLPINELSTGTWLTDKTMLVSSRKSG